MKTLRVLGAASLLALTATAYAEPYSLKDLQDLSLSAPHLEQGVDATVWQYQNVYVMDKASHTPQRLVSYVVLANGTMDPNWLNEGLIQPAGGSLQIEQAAWMDLGGTQLHDLPVHNRDGVGSVEWPLWSGEPRVLVLRYYQTMKADSPLSGLFSPRLQYPVWDASLRVLVEEGDNLFYYNSENKEPIVRKDNDNLWYGWNYAGQPATLGRQGLVAGADPFTLFSFETGTGQVQLTMDKIQSYKGKTFILKSRKTDSPAKIAKELDDFWGVPYRGAPGLFRDESLWGTGASTQMEAAALTAAALRNAGFDVKVWWQSKVAMEKEMPNSVFALTAPVFEIGTGGKSTWHYVPLRTPEPGKTPDAIAGRTLYEQRENKLVKRQYSAGKVSDNRLTAQWNLETDKTGVLSGELILTAKGKWREQLTDGDGVDLTQIQVSSTWEGSGHSLREWLGKGDVKTKKEGNALVVTLPIENHSGVLAPEGSMLLWLPSLYAMQVENLKTITGEVNLTFPFVVEQFYDVKLPDGLKPLSLPKPGSSGGGAVAYSVTQRFNNAKHKMTAEEKIVVKPTSIQAAESADFVSLLKYWGQWGRMGLPLVK